MSSVTPIKPVQSSTLEERIEAERYKLCQAIGIVNTVRFALQHAEDEDAASQWEYSLEVVDELLNGVLGRLEGIGNAST